MYTDYEKTLSFLIVPRIADLIPNEIFPRDELEIPANIQLADPNFHEPAPIDILLGSGPSLSMFCAGQIDLSRNNYEIVLQKTLLGWVIGGNVTTPTIKNSQTVNCHLSDIQFAISKFWELEECSAQIHLSAEAIACEEHFRKHTTRKQSGQYCVALPFRDNIGSLGESQVRALKRLNNLERRFERQPELKTQYYNIFEEYLELGHMSPVKYAEEFGYYLPHHAVFKETSSTTKVRIVFDGSAKSDSGLSLNDTLMVGPTIQNDIFSHLIRFRFHRFVLTGDIEKMYRQFEIRQADRKFQRILWRRDGINVETFELNTVTFGMSSSPFLAIRALQQLLNDEKHKYPKAAEILEGDLYVDDLSTGTEKIEEGIELRNDIIKLLKLGGLKIRQWASNDKRLLHGIPETDINQRLQFTDDNTLKTLGISWCSTEDQIIYSVQPSLSNTVTKRTILFTIAKIFDPLGLLGPITLLAKIIMQKLWELKLDWDTSVPNQIHTTWTQFQSQMPLINELRFDRIVRLTEASNLEIHGFCDASIKGYGACIYVKSTNNQGHSRSRLLCAKSRVAPLKTITIAQLELCGALLLSNLYATVNKAINISVHKTFLWTDSRIVYHWIHTSPHQLETFIANRVSQIQEKTKVQNWRHISSADNPADALSRGQMPAYFIRNDLWKFGPNWLINEESTWPIVHIPETSRLPGLKKDFCLTVIPNLNILNKFSSITKLKRIIAYCLRFKLKNSQKGHLKSTEIINAEKAIIRSTQMSHFSEEIRDLKLGKKVAKKSKLSQLNPFIDKDGILRVKGRLENSNLPQSQQFPMILPRSSHITNLMIEDEHLRNKHAGVQTTLYALRRRFWPLDGRNQVRKIIRKCIRCFHVNPSTAEYLMGNLPRVRITQARPFSNVGIDYCGPFYIKEKKYRNKLQIKTYVVVFICLVVKAVHLEVVSDMTTETFIGALSRFVARRGKPSLIYTDNGSNFIGANNELKELQNLLFSDKHHEKVNDYLSNRGIEWRFIPPLSPNFGGLWESTVKVFKHHFKRSIGSNLYTFEEFNTFAIEVEAILNSRPLTPISTDPNDILALTPAHFLIGDSLTSLPEEDFSSTSLPIAARWKHIQKMRQDFWKRWHKEYLNELNIRHKWHNGEHQIRVGSIVLLKEDNIPPMQWLLGRVIETFPGPDGVVRVVNVKTAKNTFKRNVRKLAPLPIDTCNENEN